MDDSRKQPAAPVSFHNRPYMEALNASEITIDDVKMRLGKKFYFKQAVIMTEHWLNKSYSTKQR